MATESLDHYSESLIISGYVIPYLKKLGYRYIEVGTQISTHQRVVRADVVVYVDKEKQAPCIVGEVRRSLSTEVTLLDPSVQRVFTNAAALGNTVRYVFVTDGSDFHWFERSPDRQTLVQLSVPPGYFSETDSVPITDQKQLVTLLQSVLGSLQDRPIEAQVLVDVMRVLVAKWQDERTSKEGRPSRFSSALTQTSFSDATIEQLYKEAVLQFPDSVLENEHVKWILSPQERLKVAKLLEPYALIETLSGTHGDLFYGALITVIDESALGRLYTPLSVANILVELARPVIGDKLIDPACGVGTVVLRGCNLLKSRLQSSQPSESQMHSVTEASCENIVGVEINPSVAKIAAMSLILNDVSPSNINVADALDKRSIQELGVELGTYDAVLLDPPLGWRITDTKITQQFELVHTGVDSSGARSEIFFVALSLDLLRPGGRLAFVVPESFLTSRSLLQVRKWLLREVQVRAIISLPKEVCSPETSIKLNVVLVEKKGIEFNHQNALVGVVRNIGRDPRGRPSQRDDIPELLQVIREFLTTGVVNNVLSEDGLSVWSVATGDLTAERLDAPSLDPRYSEHLTLIQQSPYPAVKLRDVTDIITGPHARSGDSSTVNDPMVLVRSRAVKGSEVDLSDMPTISAKQVPPSTEARIKSGDVLVVIRGPSVGEAAVVKELPQPAMVDSSVAIVRITNSDKIDSHFLALVINSSIGKNQIEHLQAPGTVLPAVHPSVLGTLTIPLPSLLKQQEIAARASEMLEEARVLAQRVEQLTASARHLVVSTLLKEYEDE